MAPGDSRGWRDQSRDAHSDHERAGQHRPGMRRWGMALALLPALGGCVDLAVAGAGQVGIEAMRERGLSGAARDTNLRVAINQRWLDSGIITDNLYLQIWEGRVLVSGAVSDP